MRPQSSATEVANRSNLLLLIQLRWIAVVGLLLTGVGFGQRVLAALEK